MIPLGLSVRDRRAFEAALVHTHRIRITVRIHDRDEKVISTISNRILGGSVDVNMGETPHRTLDLTILEPRKAPSWLPDGPSDAHVFANNFVSVRYGVWVTGLSTGADWVDVPVFWGIITGLSQDGNEVSITAAGKETLTLEPHLLWTSSFHVHKGARRVNAIRDILARKGETRFDLPDLPSKIGKKMSLNRHANPFHVAKVIAGGANLQLFYDGRGRAKVRRWPNNRQWTFKAGVDGSVLNRPRISYDVSSVRNLVEVLGPEPKGPPSRIRAVARARASNPMSAESLRWSGVKREMVEVVDSDLAKPEMEWHHSKKHIQGMGSHITPGHWGAPSGTKHPHRWLQWRHSVIVHRKAKAEEIADRHLKNRLKATVDITFDTLVIPHLEEGDVCAVMVEGQHFEFVLKQFTIPLTSDSPMSVGVNKRVSIRDKKIQHPKRVLR